ncbi:MAG: low specificity L-threonine aldolase [Lachnospiraceae bacterium]|nr:low specificity L-threonine aldolase [Lachnospiraceae bacterium]
MISFESDYNTGAHPRVLQALMDTNRIPALGYGEDPFTKQAARKILDACELEDGSVFFLSGGTQTNAVVLSSLLKPYEGVVAAESGHIAVHEAGAVEHTGHKVLTLPSHEGKMHADELEAFAEAFYSDGNHEHMVFPGAVYISQPTELGSLYSKGELQDLHAVCQRYGMALYVDGARLAFALASSEADFALPDLARLCDVFYIGGTKCGALCGEAVVFTHGNVPEHFVPIIKQQGALMAKGRLCGVQFDALFTDGLYFEIGKEALKRAGELKEVLKEAGLPFFYESPTNQQFVIIDDETMELLRQEVAFSFWETHKPGFTVIRFVIGWSTGKNDIEALRSIFKRFKG